MRHDHVEIKSRGQGCQKQGRPLAEDKKTRVEIKKAEGKDAKSRGGHQQQDWLPAGDGKKKVLMVASVASMIDQFNMPNIRLLLNMGYEVHVACNFKEGSTCDRKRVLAFQQELQAMDVVWHQWDCPRNVSHMAKCLKAYGQLWELTARHRYRWLHCHSPVGGALARLVARQRDIRVAYTAHGFHFYKGAPWKNWLLYYPVEKLLAQWTDVLITVNQEDYRFAKRNLGAGKICHIPGIGIRAGKPYEGDQGNKTDFRKKYKIPEDAAVLLSVGELSRRKNHQAVIAALASLKRQDVYYLICGQGACQAVLRKQAERLGVAGRVRMTGYLDDVAELYQNADIFVFPSLQEGMPVALMEAMDAGLPCVVSDIRGNRELIDDGPKARGGIRYPLRQPQQLCGALGKMLRDRRLRLECGRHNQDKVKGYALGVVEKRMKRIYMGMEKGRGHEVSSEASRKISSEASIKVSILLAVHAPNIDWLKQQLLSIRRQTFTRYELLIMDDGSGLTAFQGIQEMVGRCMGGQERVHLYRSSQNEGSNRTFEKLALMAKGDYIAFCDQDDIWEKEKLAMLVKAVTDEKNAVMAYSDMSVIDESGRQIQKSLRKMRKWLNYAHGGNATAKYLAENCTAGCSMLARADLVRNAMPFCGHIYCDQWVAACVSAFGTVAFVDAPLVRYRRHGGNQTGFLGQIHDRQDYYDKRVLAMCALLEEIQGRGIHFGQEEEAAAFAAARRDRDILGIWRYRRINRKYAYFDLLMLCMPDALAKAFLHMLHIRQDR